MKISEASYLEDGTTKRIFLEDLTTQIYDENYKDKLFCGVNGCPAKLVYVERRQHGISSYFRTLKGEEHLKGCINDVERQKGRRGRRSSIEDSVSLSKKHIIQVLKDTAAVASGKRKKRNPNKRDYSKSPLVDKEQEERNENNGTPSLIKLKDASDVVKREPPLIKVDVNQLSDFHVGNSYAVYGDLVRIEIGQEEYKLFFRTANDIVVYASIGNQYKKESRQAFDLIPNIDVYLKKQESDVPVKLSCAGLVEKDNNNYKVSLSREPSFLIDAKTIFAITATLRK